MLVNNITFYFLITGLTQPLILLSTVCLAFCAGYVDENDAALKKISLKEKVSVQLSSCKRKTRSAYNLCYSKLAGTEKERLACARLYVKTLIQCYYTGVASGKDCLPRGYAMFEKCVLESMGYEDIYACSNEKDAWLAKCKRATTQGDRREMLDSSDHMVFNEALYKRGNTALCNECRTRFDICLQESETRATDQICVVNKEVCIDNHSC